MKTFLAVLFFMSFAVVSSACWSDMDCGIGGKCIKVGNSIDGACYNDYETGTGSKYYEDKSPSRSGHSKSGKKCWSSFDCGIGGDCIKVGNGMYGTCTD